MIYQQGDILFEEIETIKTNKKKELEKNGYYIIAEGEATGHAHKVNSLYAELYKDDDCLLLELLKKSKIEHEEHNDIMLPKGKYKITHVKEYDHFLEESREVKD